MADVNGMRTGFVLDKDGNRILPITHMSLIIGDDGKTILGSLEEVRDAANQATDAVSEMSQTIGSYDQQIADANAAISGVDEKVSNIDYRIATVLTVEDLPVNESLMDGAIRYVVSEKKYFSYTVADGWQEMVTSGDGSGGGPNYEDDIYSHIWIGDEPPENNNMVWVDTTTDGVIEGKDDVSLLYQLLDKFAEMQNEITTLKKRVKYLEENGVFDPGTGDDDSNTSDDFDIILLEDGSSLMLEDDSGEMLLEIQTEKPNKDEGNVIMYEDGSGIYLEDGVPLLLEM